LKVTAMIDPTRSAPVLSYRYDHDDEGVLSTTQHAHSGATGLWQWVLWADGYLSESDVDCQFGAKTEAATKKWQTHFLGASQADGIVRNKTFDRASHYHALDLGGWGYGWDYSDGNLGRNVNDGRYSFRTKYTNRFVTAYYNSAANCR